MYTSFRGYIIFRAWIHYPNIVQSLELHFCNFASADNLSNISRPSLSLPLSCSSFVLSPTLSLLSIELSPLSTPLSHAIERRHPYLE